MPSCSSGWATSTRCSARTPSAPRALLGLALTTRDRDKGDQAVPMAGFPHPALESYLAKIVQAGLRAAVCEQVEDPQAGQGAGQARRRPGRHARDADRRGPARPQDGQLPGGGRRVGEQARPGLGRALDGPVLALRRAPDRAGRRDRPAQPGRDLDLGAQPRRPLAARRSAATPGWPSRSGRPGTSSPSRRGRPSSNTSARPRSTASASTIGPSRSRPRGP